MKTEIDALFASNRLDEAEQALLAMPADAYTLYMRGRIAWKRGLRREAITMYEESAEIEPDPATALEQARAIMAFYNKDLYNP